MQQEVDLEDELYTVNRVALYLHVKPRTVREWIREGKLKALKLNDRWLIKKSELKKFVNDQSSNV